MQRAKGLRQHGVLRASRKRGGAGVQDEGQKQGMRGKLNEARNGSHACNFRVSTSR